MQIALNQLTAPHMGLGTEMGASAIKSADQVPIMPPSFLVMTMVAERGRLPAP